jgi:hypothetical protein
VSIWWKIELLSASCFAGSAPDPVGTADHVQELDELGLPRIGARSLRGLLVEEVSLLIRVLEERDEATWHGAASRLLGEPGTREGRLWLDDARWASEAEREALEAGIATEPPLASLATRATTIVRAQTALDEETGTAARGSLRSARLASAGTVLRAEVRYRGGWQGASPEEKALLAAGVSLVRRGGMHRTRGWGRICSTLVGGENWMEPLLVALGAKP